MNKSSSSELAQTIDILGMLLMLLAQEFSQDHQLLEGDNWQPIFWWHSSVVTPELDTVQCLYNQLGTET